jgi:hypothetical protein
MNWINTKIKEVLTNGDKLKILLKPSVNLVLVQKDTLELLRGKKLNAYDINYIGRLYDDYIVNQLGKTYLNGNRIN